MNQKGLSLLETVIAGSVLVLVLGLSLSMFRKARETGAASSQKREVTANVFLAVRAIQRVGRAAQMCRKTVVGGGAAALDCLVDFGRPATGNLEWVRFTIAKGVLAYQKDKKNDGKFTATSDKLTYPDVTGLEICDDTSMADGTCPLKPSAISAFHTNTIVAGKENRFFRYALTSIPVSLSGQKDLVKVVHTGAFYRRNPTPFAPAVFQW